MQRVKNSAVSLLIQDPEIFEFTQRYGLSGIAIFDLSLPEKLWLNPQILKNLGHIIPENLNQLFNIEDFFSCDYWQLKLKSILHDHVLTGDLKLKAKNASSKSYSYKVILPKLYPGKLIIALEQKHASALQNIAESISADVSSEEIAKMKRRFELKQLFIQQAPTAIAMFDKSLKYIAASKRWLRDYNIEDKEIIGKSHYEIFPEIGEDWKKIHQECLNGAVHRNDEEYFERLDGTHQWISWEVRPWYNSENEIGGIIMHTADITDLKNNETDSYRKQELMSKVLESIDVGIVACDANGNITLFNKATKEWHGLPAHPVPKEELSDHYGLYNADGTRTLKEEEIPLLKALKNGTIKNDEIRIRPNSGKEVVVAVNGNQLFNKNGELDGAVVAMHNITHRKEAERKLMLALGQLEGIFEASSQVSIIATDIYGTITSFNKGSEKLLGFSREEMEGKMKISTLHSSKQLKHFAKKTGVDLNDLHHGIVSKTVNPDKIFKDHNWKYVRKSGSKFPVQLAVTAIKENGEIIGYLYMATNISKLKNTEAELSNIMILTQEQNARLKNFAHIVSHNLRSHSSNLGMLLDLFKKDHPELVEDTIISLLDRASDNLAETIEHLNEVVLVNTTVSDNLKPVCINQSLEKVIDSLSAIIRRENVEIQNNVAKESFVKGIPAYIESILLNFITNAIKYRSQEREAEVNIYTEESSEYIKLIIEDNGLGIDLKKNGRKLFGMYKTFHQHKDSRGIGLFITKNQIEALGGKVEVESVINQGTKFKIYLIKHEES